MKPPTLAEWLQERYDNAVRISKQKTGEDRLGWLADASYFLRSKEAINQLTAASSDEANNPLRMYIAIKILRAWNHGTAGYHAGAVAEVNGWIDGGMKGPVPWPDSPFFDAWAQANGLSKVGDYVGFRFTAELTEPQQ